MALQVSPLNPRVSHLGYPDAVDRLTVWLMGATRSNGEGLPFEQIADAIG